MPWNIVVRRHTKIKFACHSLKDVKWFYTEDVGLPNSAAIATGSAHSQMIDTSGFLYCYGVRKDGKYIVDYALFDVTGKTITVAIWYST